MKEDTKKIIIKKIKDTKGDYLAVYKDGFLRSTFSLIFKDNIFGAVSLNHFTEMIKKHFGIDSLSLYIADETIDFRTEIIINTFSKYKKEVS